MKLLVGLREVLYNFANPVEDVNAPTVEISAEAFVKMAKKSGMTPEQIQECLKNMNGITVTKKSKRPVQEVREEEQQQTEQQQIEQDRAKEDKNKGREPGE